MTVRAAAPLPLEAHMAQLHIQAPKAALVPVPPMRGQKIEGVVRHLISRGLEEVLGFVKHVTHTPIADEQGAARAQALANALLPKLTRGKRDEVVGTLQSQLLFNGVQASLEAHIADYAVDYEYCRADFITEFLKQFKAMVTSQNNEDKAASYSQIVLMGQKSCLFGKAMQKLVAPLRSLVPEDRLTGLKMWVQYTDDYRRAEPDFRCTIDRYLALPHAEVIRQVKATAATVEESRFPMLYWRLCALSNSCSVTASHEREYCELRDLLADRFERPVFRECVGMLLYFYRAATRREHADTRFAKALQHILQSAPSPETLGIYVPKLAILALTLPRNTANEIVTIFRDFLTDQLNRLKEGDASRDGIMSCIALLNRYFPNSLRATSISPQFSAI